jgi:hypothetical protein
MLVKSLLFQSLQQHCPFDDPSNGDLLKHPPTSRSADVVAFPLLLRRRLACITTPLYIPSISHFSQSVTINVKRSSTDNLQMYKQQLYKRWNMGRDWQWSEARSALNGPRTTSKPQTWEKKSWRYVKKKFINKRSGTTKLSLWTTSYSEHELTSSWNPAEQRRQKFCQFTKCTGQIQSD